MPAPPAAGDRLGPFSLPVYPAGLRRWAPGRVTVFSFCAFWCDTWKEQNERLAAAGAALAGLPVDYLTVSVDGRWAERGRDAIRTPILLDPGGAVSRRWHINAVPYTLVADRQGTVRFAVQGIARAADLLRVVRELIRDDAPAPGGTVYLTFDDFPAGAGDDDLLDILRARRVPGTLFCIGRGIDAHRVAIRRAYREGHVLQVHSWDHDAADPQLSRCARALADAAGARPTLYRPPGSDRLFRLDGAEVRRHVVNPYDYTRPGASELLRRVRLAVKPGSVVLLHAGVAETRTVLPELIAGLRQRGMDFGTLG